jgi:hypothetical protein
MPIKDPSAAPPRAKQSNRTAAAAARTVPSA